MRTAVPGSPSLFQRPLGGGEKDEDRKVFDDVEEAVVNVAGDVQHIARTDVATLAGGGEAGSAGEDVVDLVLGVGLLRVAPARAEVVDAHAEGGNAEEFE